MRAWMPLASALVLALCAACSLALDWDQSRLKCASDANAACLTGYTCLDNHCVANSSLSTGEACNATAQCTAEDLCAQSFLDRPCTGDSQCDVCLDTCSLGNAYTQLGCGTEMFCQPYCAKAVTESAPGIYKACDPNARLAACAQSAQCTANQTCTLSDSSAKGVCTAVGTDVTACLPACSFDWSAGYNDGCGFTTDRPGYCTPIGTVGNGQLVCIVLGAASELSQGATGCDALLHPCQPGFACIADACSQLCNIKQASSCATAGEKCTAIPDMGPSPPGITTDNVGYCN